MRSRAPLLSASRSRAVAAPVLVVALAAVACVGDGATPAYDVEWGIDGRADEVAGCDSSSDLCWTSEDAGAMRRYLASQQSLLLEEDPGSSAQGLVEALEALSDKMRPDERRSVALLRAQAEGLAAEPTDDERLALLSAAHAAAGERLLSGYLTAYAVPLGRSAAGDDAGQDRADSWSGGEPPLPETDITDGMRESLDLLRQAGPLGSVYAFMLEHAGLLEDLPLPAEGGFPSGEPREVVVDRIVRRACWATAGWSTVAAAESLIPYAGIVISISHEALMHFRLRARMVFEIAALYGLDLREDLNLFLATTAMMTSYDLPEMQALWTSSMALPVLATAVERAGGAAPLRTVVMAALVRAVQPMLASISARGAEILDQVAVRATARAAGRSVLGYATFGIALVGDVALTTATTAGMGEHVDAMLRPWGTGMLEEAATTMSDPAARDCAALLLGRTIWADGEATDDERGLLAAHLGRDIFVGGRFVRMGPDAEIYYLARRAASVRDRDEGEVSAEAEYCVDASFVGLESRERLSLLEWTLTMAAVDGRLDATEAALFDDLVEELAGSDWLGDGDELEGAHLDAMEGRVRSLLLEADRDPSFGDLLPGSLIERRDELAPRAEAAVAAAFGG